MPNFSHMLGPALFAYQLDLTGNNPVERLRLFQEGVKDSTIRRVLAKGPWHEDAVDGLHVESPWWLAAQADTLTAPNAVASLLSHLETDLAAVAGLVLPRLSPAARPLVVAWARQRPAFLRSLLLSTDRDTRAWAIGLAGDMQASPEPSPLPAPTPGRTFLHRVWRTVRNLPPVGEDIRAKWLPEDVTPAVADVAAEPERPRRVMAAR